MTERKRIYAAGYTVLFFILCGIRLLVPLHATAFEERVPVYAEELLQSVSSGDVQKWLDETLPAQTGLGTSDWYAMILSARGGYDLSVYCNALQDYLASENPSAAVTCERMALTLAACAPEPPAICTELLDRSAGQMGIMSWVFALHLINNGVPSESFTAEAIVSELLSRQSPDGGWSLKGDAGDVDVTTMTLQALAPYRNTEIVSDAISDGIAFLSAAQLPSGAYQSLGAENPESTAQVWTALSLLGIDALEDDRFIASGNTLLDGILQFRTADGRFSHTHGGEVSDMATMQVYEALTAAELQQSGRNMMLFHGEISPLALESSAFPQKHETTAISASETVSGMTSETTEIIHTTAQPANPQSSMEKYPYRLPLTLAAGIIFGTMAIVCVIRKRRSPKTYLTILGGFVAVTALIWFIKIESADQFYENAARSGGGTVTMEIRCDAICGLPGGERYPSDGVMMPLTAFSISENENVLELLYDAVKAYELQIEVDGVSGGAVSTAYVRGIASLYEFDFGDLSGWTYTVNGERPSLGCGACPVHDGDRIVWFYSVDL